MTESEFDQLHQYPTPPSDEQLRYEESLSEKDVKEERLKAYFDWHLSLLNQLKSGAITEQQMSRTVSRSLLARDLLYERQYELARTDRLTKLPNRLAFEEVLPRFVEKYQQHGDSFALFLLDLDNFKTINDKYGHSAGDSVLIQSALRISLSIRQLNIADPGSIRRRKRENEESDFAFRYGGEEIGVIAGNVNSVEDARIVGEKIRNAVSGSPFAVTNIPEPIMLTASVGGGIYSGEETRELISRIDTQALYKAKELGRNRVIILE